MKQPTIAELEAILAENDVKIDIRPNGEVFVCSERDNLQQRIAELEGQLAEAKKAAEKFILLVDKCDLHGPAIQCREASNELANAIGFSMKKRFVERDSPSATQR